MGSCELWLAVIMHEVLNAFKFVPDVDSVDGCCRRRYDHVGRNPELRVSSVMLYLVQT
jgi:hypothetical protein